MGSPQHAVMIDGVHFTWLIGMHGQLMLGVVYPDGSWSNLIFDDPLDFIRCQGIRTGDPLEKPE